MAHLQQISSFKHRELEDQSLEDSAEEETEPSASGEVKMAKTPEALVPPAPTEKDPNPFAAHITANSESFT
ncbi:hypothetical protein [Candidatus Nitronereus thalassa]|uniref:Uncharacterized protein n=1 Tax=Candidatus Nitronereus thalassa TaxID=3020898 RepID=A0ABU3K6Y4_9BACT|nr:hypothetical protein [Candidatus Nitronereus thalassa]MDT7042098.1 hypothetical protein [Candidatus Nitronereus thalassa]